MRKGGQRFWSVRDPAKAVAIDLDGEPFSRLSAQVPDPQGTVRANAAARRRAR